MNTYAYYKTEISNLTANFDMKQIEELCEVIKNKYNTNEHFKKKSLAGIWNDIDLNEWEIELFKLRENVANDLENKTL